MNQFSIRSIQTVTLAVIIIGVILLALGGYLTPVLRITSQPWVTAQTWVSDRYNAVRDFLTAPRDLAGLQQENQQLKQEIADLRAQVIGQQQQLEELGVLSSLLDFARTNPQNRYLAGSVIARDPSPFLHYVIINRGSDDGVRRGMPVVTSEGIVGRVSAVTPAAARVQLVTDPQAVINVQLQPSDTEAILRGSMTGDLFLEQISQEAEVQPGDLVLTSGLGGGFPNNILVGQVSGIRSLATDIFQRASVQPIVDFSDLDIVLVITSFRPVDISPLAPEGSP
ncbi:MAG: rod shape-determining protein MreC [Anaerolineales bacterium]|nr:rod shape-determining protein MreC [Anaerolineales bacterium]